MDRTIAVIGHVDHGKTSLVKALTGVETDTLKEERERGLSIALGFASLAMEAGRLHFVDAPGHADFIQTTASGVSGADAVLLVVSVADGVSAQTIEHLKLAKLFGIETVIVAFTKSDLGDMDTQTARRGETAELLASFGLPDAPVIACSSVSKAGLEDLRGAFETCFQSKSRRVQPSAVYLLIDRVFNVQGAGTVVTGTLLGGDLQTDSPVRLEPGSIETSVRGLQVAGTAVERAIVGSRVAVNLRNVELSQIQKGDVLCAPGCFAPSHRFDVAIEAEPQRVQALRHMEQVVVLYGARHAAARIRLYASGPPNTAGAPTIAQLEFQAPQIGFTGQRFVIRRPAALETVAGGTILDPQAALITRNKSDHVKALEAAAELDTLSAAKALAGRDQGCVDLKLLARLTRSSIDACASALSSDFVLDGSELAFETSAIEALEDQIVATLTDFHEERPCRPCALASVLTLALKQSPQPLTGFATKNLLKNEVIQQVNDGFALTSHDANAAMSEHHRAAYSAVNDRLKSMGLTLSGLFDDMDLGATEQDDMVELLIANGQAVRLHNHALRQSVLLHAETIDAAARTLAQAFAPSEGFTTGQARQTLQTNRKTIVPLLEYFDTLGITVRRGDLRVLQSPGDTPCDPCDAS